jgi:hypothetical protein
MDAETFRVTIAQIVLYSFGRTTRGAILRDGFTAEDTLGVKKFASAHWALVNSWCRFRDGSDGIERALDEQLFSEHLLTFPGAIDGSSVKPPPNVPASTPVTPKPPSVLAVPKSFFDNRL